MATNKVPNPSVVTLDEIAIVARNLRTRSPRQMTYEEAEAIARKSIDDSPGFIAQPKPVAGLALDETDPSYLGDARAGAIRSQGVMQQFREGRLGIRPGSNVRTPR